MATKPVVISFDLEAADAFEKASELGLEIKQQNEVYAGWSSLNAWRDIFEKDFGLLQRVISRSNPDDPPDLNFEFAMRTLSVEITDILPHPYGQVHSIHQREMPNECITLPPISVKYKSKEEIRQAMVSRLWISEPVGDRRRELLRVVAAQVNRKAKRLVTANVKLDVL